jgi:hypothetical protein
MVRHKSQPAERNLSRFSWATGELCGQFAQAEKTSVAVNQQSSGKVQVSDGFFDVASRCQKSARLLLFCLIASSIPSDSP